MRTAAEADAATEAMDAERDEGASRRGADGRSDGGGEAQTQARQTHPVLSDDSDDDANDETRSDVTIDDSVGTLTPTAVAALDVSASPMALEDFALDGDGNVVTPGPQQDGSASPVVLEDIALDDDGNVVTPAPRQGGSAPSEDSPERRRLHVATTAFGSPASPPAQGVAEPFGGAGGMRLRNLSFNPAFSPEFQPNDDPEEAPPQLELGRSPTADAATAEEQTHLEDGDDADVVISERHLREADDDAAGSDLSFAEALSPTKTMGVPTEPPPTPRFETPMTHVGQKRAEDAWSAVASPESPPSPPPAQPDFGAVEPTAVSLPPAPAVASLPEHLRNSNFIASMRRRLQARGSAQQPQRETAPEPTAAAPRTISPAEPEPSTASSSASQAAVAKLPSHLAQSSFLASMRRKLQARKQVRFGAPGSAESAAELSTTEAETDGDASPRKALPSVRPLRSERARDSSSSDEDEIRAAAQVQTQPPMLATPQTEATGRLEYSPLRLRDGEALSDTETLKSIRARRRAAAASITSESESEPRGTVGPLKIDRQQLSKMERGALESALLSQIDFAKELSDDRTIALEEMALLGEQLYATDNERVSLQIALADERARSATESDGGSAANSQVSFLRRVLAKVEASRDAARAELARVKRAAAVTESRSRELANEIETREADASETRRRLRAEHARGAELQRALEASNAQVLDHFERLIAMHRFAALAVAFAALIALRLWLGPRDAVATAAAAARATVESHTVPADVSAGHAAP